MLKFILLTTLFSSYNKFPVTKEGIPQGLLLRMQIGGECYENLSKTNTNIIDPGLPKSSTSLYLGGGIDYNRSIWDIQTIFNAFYGDLAPTRDTSYTLADMALGMKIGAHILPYNWDIQFIPEFGYALHWEETSKTHLNKQKQIDNYIYKEELGMNGIAPGFLLLYKIKTRGMFAFHSLGFNYSHNEFKEIKMDNYSLEWRSYTFKIKRLQLTDAFLGASTGLTTKSDGRKSYYLALDIGHFLRWHREKEEWEQPKPQYEKTPRPGFVIKENNIFPKGAYFSFEVGLPHYENLAKARNHPLSYLADYKVFLCGAGTISYNAQRWDAEAFLNITHQGDMVVYLEDTMCAFNQLYTGLKAGLHTLPSYLPVNVIPEIGYLYFDEYLKKYDKNDYNITYYNEELKGFSLAPGFSVLYKYTDIFLKCTYFHNNIGTVKMDNYIVDLRWYPNTAKADKNNYELFIGIESGLTNKTDGRIFYYLSGKIGGNLVEMIKEGNKK